MSFKLSIGKCAIAGVDLYTNEAIVAFNSNDETILSNQYLYYYLSTRDFSNAGKGSLGAGSMNKGSLSELTMPLPPIEFQHTVLSRLDALQSQLTALESLQKQSEDNARFILESYLGSAHSVNEVEESKEELTESESDTSSAANEIITPEEPASAAAASSASVKIVKRRKVKIAKTMDGST